MVKGDVSDAELEGESVTDAVEDGHCQFLRGTRPKRFEVSRFRGLSFGSGVGRAGFNEAIIRNPKSANRFERA